MGCIILLAILWLIQGNPIAITIDWQHLIPSWHNSQSWISLTAIMTSFLGMELAAVHVRNIDNPQKNFPRAIFVSVILILTTMILGSLAIALVLPQHEIGLVNGVMQAFTNFFSAYNLTFMMPIIVIMILLGSVGSLVNWIISPAKGLLLAADNGFLPHWLYRLNKHNIASRILILQAILVTLFCGSFTLFPTINAIYWLFTALSTEIYIMMYVIMFVAAIYSKSKFKEKKRLFAVPGGKKGYYLTCFLGILGCIITLIIGFFPPQQSMNLGGVNHFRIIFGSGIIIMLLPALYFIIKRNYYRKIIKY